MIVKVKTLTGKEIPVELDGEDSVYHIKELVEQKEGIPPSQQRLIFQGKQIKYPRNVVGKAMLRPTENMDGAQISADDIVRDVYKERSKATPVTRVDVLDLEELRELQRRKRAEFESYLKRNRLDVGEWLRYAQFEVEQHDMRRARSVFERALLVHPSHIPLWIRYIDSELKSKYINHARNLLNRAVSTLPRVNKLWYKYVLLEEILDNTEIVRSLFQKWCSLEPTTDAWDTFIEFETRHEMWDNARTVFAQYVMVHPDSKTWLKWVQFENKHGTVDDIRRVYSVALDALFAVDTDMEKDLTELVISFASWEASQNELERAKAIYQISLNKWPQNKALENDLAQHEKRYGSSSSAQKHVIDSRRANYEEMLALDSHNYDTWWSYLDLIENEFKDDLLSCFQKAVAAPPINTTKVIMWSRYIYLWIRYLIYMELQENNISYCRQLYEQLLSIIQQHKSLNFSEIWIMYAEFEIRQHDLNAARKVMGRALGLCPESILFEKYIEFEIKLREFDRVRKIYEKYLDFDPSRKDIWLKYANLEKQLGDEERARAIYTISLLDDVDALSQESKISIMETFIEFEIKEEEYDNARGLYEKYLEISNHALKVWIEFAMYEASSPTSEQIEAMIATNDTSDEENLEFEATDENRERARAVFERGLEYYKNNGDKQNRHLLLKAYQDYEKQFGSPANADKISDRFPKEVPATRMEGAVEVEFTDLVFPDDAKGQTSPLKILELAKRWKKEQQK